MRDAHVVTVQMMRHPFGPSINPDITPVILERPIPRKRCGIGLVMWWRAIDDPVAYNAEPDAHPPNATPSCVGLSAPLP